MPFPWASHLGAMTSPKIQPRLSSRGTRKVIGMLCLTGALPFQFLAVASLALNYVCQDTDGGVSCSRV